MPDGLDDYLSQFKPKAKKADTSVASVLDDEFSKLGYGDNARLSILGDVGRENNWKRSTIFKGHLDPKNGAYNRGIISWQGDRQTALNNHLKREGVYGKNNDDELRGMARFMDKELQSKEFAPIHQKLLNAKSTAEASDALHQYIKYVPVAPYNSPDPNFKVKNNADWAHRAQQAGLGSKGLDSYLAQFQNTTEPESDGLGEYLAQFQDSKAPQPVTPTVASPQTIQPNVEAPAVAEQSVTIPEDVPPAQPILANADPTKLFGGNARVAPSVQTAAQNAPVAPNVPKNYVGSEPVISDVPEDTRPQQAVTPQNQNNAVVETFDVKPNATTRDILNQVALKYGIDVNKVLAENPDLNIVGNNGKVDLTYGDLTKFGVDTAPLIRQKVVENRVENPTPNLRVGSDFTKDDADALREKFGDRAGTWISGLIAIGGKTAGQLAGLVRLLDMTNPVSGAIGEIKPGQQRDELYDYLKGIGDTAQSLSKASGKKELTFDQNGRPIISDDMESMLTKKAIEIGGDLTRLYAMGGALPGASSVLGKMGEGAALFGTQNALETAGQGGSTDEIKRQTLKGIATGGLFGAAGKVADAATDVVGTLANKAIPAALTEGIHIGTIAGGTYGIDKIAGDSDTAALQESIVNSLFHVVPKVLGKTVEFVGSKLKVRVSDGGAVTIAPRDAKADVTLETKDGEPKIVKVTEPITDAVADDLRKKVAPPRIPKKDETTDEIIPNVEPKGKETFPATNEADNSEAKLAERPDGTLKNKNEYTPEEWKDYTKSVIDKKLKESDAKQQDSAQVTDKTETNGTPVSTAPETTEKPAAKINAVVPDIPAPKEQRVSSTKNRIVEEERAARDATPIEKAAKEDFGTVWDKAAAEVKKNPQAGEHLVRELQNNPKHTPTPEENAILLHHKIELQNQFDERAKALVKAIDSGDEAEAAAARIRLAPVRDALDDVDRVTTAAGTAAGRGLNARRMMANEDFTFAALELRTRAAKGGKELTNEEFKQLQKVADDYKEKNKILDQHLSDRELVISKMEANWPNARVITAAENIVKKLDTRAEAARERLKKRGAVFTSGIDPLALKDLAEIGAAHIASAGLDLAKWTEKMVNEFGEKVRPHLDKIWLASNEIFDGHGARDKVIGRRPTDEVKLKAWKTRAANRVVELSKKVEEGDFTRKKRVPFTKFDNEALKLRADVERVVRQFNRGIRKKELEGRTKPEKAQDFATKWRRMAVLSGPSTLAKLTAAALGRTVTAPIEQIAEHGWGKVLPKLAKQMTREYGFRTIAEAKAITEMLTSGIKDALKNLKNQDSDLETVFGKPHLLENSKLEYFGSIHAALKAPVKRSVFARHMELGFAKVIKDGGDPLDPLIQTQVGLQAFKAAERGIFMQDNTITKAYQSGVDTLQRPGKSGHPTSVGKAVATGMKLLMPIVKIPTNFVGETVQYATGLPVGVAKAVKAYRNGIENLPPEDADTIMRWLSKGSLGAGALALGALMPQAFGGYYQGKRDEKDVPPGGIRLFGYNIPPLLLHTPLLATMQIGANFRRVMDSKLKKKDEETQGATMALIASAIGLIEEVPFVKETANVSKLLEPKTRMDFLYDLGKNALVPQLSSQTAAYLDKPGVGAKKYIPFAENPIKRKPIGLWQTIETGIPVLRQNVPADKENALDPLKVSPAAQDVQAKHNRFAGVMDRLEKTKDQGLDTKSLEKMLSDKLARTKTPLTQEEAERANRLLGTDKYKAAAEKDAPPPTFSRYNKNADGIIERTVGWAKALGTDPVDAFDKLLKGETFARLENGAIIVKRMNEEASASERKRLGGGAKSVKLDHTVPLELGGTNAQSNLRLVTTDEWQKYTPIENYLGEALHDGKISKSEAQEMIRDFKDGKITPKNIADRVGVPIVSAPPPLVPATLRMRRFPTFRKH